MTNLIIKNVPQSIGTYSLKDLCRRYGEVSNTKRQEGQVHVKMPNRREAKDAYQAINGMPFLGSPLEVVLQ